MNYKRTFLIFTFILSVGLPNAFSQKEQVRIAWKDGTLVAGTVHLQNGVLTKVELAAGKGKVKGNIFQFTSGGSASILVGIDSVQNGYGTGATVVSIKTVKNPFSFFVRDVSFASPIFLPDYGVVVLIDTDKRTYQEVEIEVLSRKLRTKIQRIETEKEVSFSSAESTVRNMTVPTWLGTSRDFRIFEIAESLSDGSRGESNIISPKL